MTRLKENERVVCIDTEVKVSSNELKALKDSGVNFKQPGFLNNLTIGKTYAIYNPDCGHGDVELKEVPGYYYKQSRFISLKEYLRRNLNLL